MLHKYRRFFLLVGLCFLFGLLPFADVWAQAAPRTAQQQLNQLAQQSSNIPKLIATICYVIGVFYAARALIALKNYISNADENPINNFISHGAVGALLIMLPYTIIVMANTFGAVVPSVESSAKTLENNSALTAELAGAPTWAFGTVFANLSRQVLPLAKAMAIFAYVLAAIIAFIGLLHLKNYGDDPSQVPVRSILIKFVLATMLISLPFAMQIFVTSVTGANNIESQGNVACVRLMNSSQLATLRNSQVGCR